MRTERNCEFAVLCSTGERPDAEIHIVAFEEDEGVAVCGKMAGGLRNHVRLVEELVKTIGKSVLEHDGEEAAAAYACIIGNALKGSLGEEVMAKATEMLSPKGILKAIEDVVKKLAESAEEEGDDE